MICIYFLGISAGMHDPAVALVKDNKIVAFVEEERFNRIKHSKGFFPHRSLEWVLKKEGIKISDIDKIGFYLNPSFSNMVLKKTFNLLKSPIEFGAAIRWKNRIKKIPISGLKYYFKYKTSNIEYINHHLCHSASTFLLSGFKKSNILTIDGVGEIETTTMRFGDRNKIEMLQSVYDPNSLGYVYSCVTEFLGFESNEGEGKVMGLAPYGNKYYKIFDNFIKIKGETFEVNPKLFLLDGTSVTYTDYLTNKLGEPRISSEPIEKKHMDIAFSLQERLEQVVLHLVENLIETTGNKNLCLAGGVALNCKMNGRILESGLIDDIFIQPAAGDAGCALGAALWLAHNEGFKFKKMEHIYYGPEYSDEEVKKVLDTAHIKYEEISDPSGTAAELLSQGKIVGWFQGRMEAGPRALGNRSILADPRDPGIKDKLNYLVKHREPFRPFCPSLLDKAKKEYFENPYESPFMILSFKVKEEKRKEIPGVVHVDGTVRPQTVTKKTNHKYYKLIEEFEKLTGVPVVLNTSFNIKGEPMVCTPAQALADFYSTGMDALIINNFLITK
ncbi:MAG: carbamoyltransferase [Candidatus Aenigmatarchaeota archaeon]